MGGHQAIDIIYLGKLNTIEISVLKPQRMIRLPDDQVAMRIAMRCVEKPMDCDRFAARQLNNEIVALSNGTDDIRTVYRNLYNTRPRKTYGIR
jgi:hypothetical protein